MKINYKKVEELKSSSIERALNEGYLIATKGIKIEDLRLFEFQNGKVYYVIADNIDNAIGFHMLTVGENEIIDFEIAEIKSWHNLHLYDEDDNIKNTLLDEIKVKYSNGYNNPCYITFPGVLRDKFKVNVVID